MARKNALILLAVTLLLFVASPGYYSSASPDSGMPVLGIWSPQHGTNNVTDISLGIDSQLVININMTNAPMKINATSGGFNSYDLSLYFDSRILDTTVSQIDMENQMFGNAFVVAKEIVQPGRLRLAAVDLSGLKEGNGTLVQITFTVKGIGVSPIVLAAPSAHHSVGAQAFTQVTSGDVPVEMTTSDGYFSNVAGKLGPVAVFTHSPSPREGEPVRFNATDSYDPDNFSAPNNGILSYTWDCGDGSACEPRRVFNHTFATGIGAAFFGNFSVLLTVTDSEGFQGMKASRVEISELPFHDVQVTIQAQPETVDKGENISLTVKVTDAGTFDEVFSLTVTYGPPFALLQSVPAANIAAKTSKTYSLILTTSDLAVSTYAVNATVTIEVDDKPLNNQALAIVRVQGTSSSPILYVIAGVVGVGVAAAIVSVILRRRRKPET